MTSAETMEPILPVEQQRLPGRVAVITGSGSGIGKAAAIRLAQHGAKVCLMDMNDDRIAQVKHEIMQVGGDVMADTVDVSDADQLQKAFEAVNAAWGHIDIVFANAGINGMLAPIESLTNSDWDQTMNTNLKSCFLTVKYAVPYMKEQGGSIIITSSINGSRSFSAIGMSAYSTSKAGQIAFAKMAALELARYKIRVNVICPGTFETNISDMTYYSPELEKLTIPVVYPQGNKPLAHAPGQPQQVADLVLFLASQESSHITGTEIFIDGGETLL